MVHLHRHLLISWTFALGTHVLLITYIIAICAIEGLADGLDDGLDCLAELFPSNGHFGHSDKLELLEDLDASFNEILMDLIHYSFAPLILFRVPYTLDLLP